MRLDPKDLHILRHTIGWPKDYRNYFVTHDISDAGQRIKGLIARGLMECAIDRDPNHGGMSIYRVTPEGRMVIKAAEGT